MLVYCPLTPRQKLLYQAIKNKISIEDLLQSSTTGTDKAGSAASSLMNLVMQFRKVHSVFRPCVVACIAVMLSDFAGILKEFIVTPNDADIVLN